MTDSLRITIYSADLLLKILIKSIYTCKKGGNYENQHQQLTYKIQTHNQSARHKTPGRLSVSFKSGLGEFFEPQ